MYSRASLIRLRPILALLLLPGDCVSEEAVPHRDFDSANLRVVYTSSLFQYEASSIDQLRQLLDAGMNTIVAQVRTASDMSDLIAKVRSDATLRHYKYILGLHGPIYDAYIQCQQNPVACNASTPLPQHARNFLDQVTRAVMDNADLFVGYYTFDEPTRSDPQPGVPRYPVDAWFQRKIYQYLRSLDPDVASRPVAIANTFCDPDLTDAVINQRAAADAQDVIFLDQYQTSETDQVVCLQKWRKHNLLVKPAVLILKAFTSPGGGCASGDVFANARAVEMALDATYAQPQPFARYGYGYFAHWPSTERDFDMSTADCPRILGEVLWHTRTSLDHMEETVAWQSMDVDRDGRLDIVQLYDNAGRLGGTVYRPQDGRYVVSASGGRAQMGAGSPALAWLSGDVDADGRTDLMQPWDNAGRMGLIVYRSDGVGYPLTWGTTDTGQGSAARAWLTGDVDGDGRTDIMQPWDNAGRLGLIVHRSSGGLGYSVSWGSSDIGEGSAGLAWLTGDVDADGRTDIIQPWDNAGRLGLIVYRSDGVAYSPTWGTSDAGEGSPALAWLTGDVDGDRRTDIIQPWDNAGRLGLIVYRSDGVRYQRVWGTSDMGEGSAALAWLTGDVDGDGRTDIIQPWDNQGRVGLIVYRSDGTGYHVSWGASQLGPGAHGSAWLVGDANGDRRTDLVQVWNQNGALRFITYLSNGTGFTVIAPQ